MRPLRRACLAVCLPPLVALAQPRLTVDLCGRWQIAPAREGKFPPKGPWRDYNVPSFLPRSERAWWCRKTFRMPEIPKGFVARLHFDDVKHSCEVYLNGRRVGSALGGYRPLDFDVTPYVKPGRTNELLVLVRDWTSLLSKPFDLEKLRKHPFPIALVKGSIIAPVGAAGNVFQFGIWQKVEIRVLPPVHIDDIFVKPSVRKRRVDAEILVRNDTPAAKVVKVSAVVIDEAGRAVVRASPAEVDIPAGAPKAVELSLPADRLELWWPHRPVLYTLVVKAECRGLPADEARRRFGYREVWVRGWRLILNGLPMVLRGMWAHGPAMTKEAAERALKIAKRANCNVVRWHGVVFPPHAYEAADEIGMLIIEESPLYCYSRQYALDNPRFWELTKEQFRGWIRRDRNHPSVVIWSVENELLSVGGAKVYPKLARRLAELAELIRKLDGTRPIMFESDADPEGAADIISLHYPRDWPQVQTLPNEAWWLPGPIPYHPWASGPGFPPEFKWDRRKPLYIGEMCHADPPYAPRASTFFGERAYADPARYRGEASALAYRFYIEAYRANRAGCALPLSIGWNWDPKNPYIRAGVKWFKPLFAFVKEYSPRLYGGREAERTIYVCNDTFRVVKGKVFWRLKMAGRTVAAGSMPTTLWPAQARSFRARFRVPRVGRPARLTFEFGLADARGKVLFSESRALYAHPAPRLTVPEGVRIVLLDPSGRTASALKGLGVPFSAARRLDRKALSKANLLLIGEGAEPGGLDRGALLDFVERGGVVVRLAQKGAPDWLPVGMEFDPSRRPTFVHVASPGHPLVKGLDERDLRFFAPDNVVAEGEFLKPPSGPVRAVLESADASGLRWTPLCEVPWGKGAFVLCQVRTVKVLGVEPTAALLLERLLCYPVERPKPPDRAVAVHASLGDLAGMLFHAGVEHEPLATLRGCLSDPRRIAILPGGLARAAALGKEAGRLSEFLRRGGTAIVWRPHPLVVGLLARSLGIDISPSVRGRLPVVRNEAAGPLIWGLSNHDLHWVEPRPPGLPGWWGRRLFGGISQFAFEGDGLALTDPPSLRVVPVGKGRLVLCDLNLDGSHRYGELASRALSALLLNLGAKFGPARTTERGLPFYLDLSPFCNRGFRDEKEGDKVGGWTDQGPNDLREFPTGELTLDGTPFDVLDPEENEGKTCIVLRGGPRQYFPLEVEGIGVGRRVLELHFLHTCAWAARPGEPVMFYTLHYADGSETVIPIRFGLDIDNWWQERVKAPPRARVAWAGRNPVHEPVLVYHYRWVNPRPDVPVESLDIRSANTGAVPIVIAITGQAPLPGQKVEAERPSPPELTPFKERRAVKRGPLTFALLPNGAIAHLTLDGRPLLSTVRLELQRHLPEGRWPRLAVQDEGVGTRVSGLAGRVGDLPLFEFRGKLGYLSMWERLSVPAEGRIFLEYVLSTAEPKKVAEGRDSLFLCLRLPPNWAGGVVKTEKGEAPLERKFTSPPPLKRVGGPVRWVVFEKKGLGRLAVKFSNVAQIGLWDEREWFGPDRPPSFQVQAFIASPVPVRGKIESAVEIRANPM